jgi:hypothetical protein
VITVPRTTELTVLNGSGYSARLGDGGGTLPSVSGRSLYPITQSSTAGIDSAVGDQVVRDHSACGVTGPRFQR